ncbi:MAG: hypothetical protein K0R14_673 [Burkholderiales bacterium]|jgi:hypothetical protein|nr:hypothetical protein [Burkholderiales bacterium]
MRKLLISLLAVSSTASFAVANNSEFQEFDNVANIGWGMNQTSSSYGTAAGVPGKPVTTGNVLQLEAERLFNSGVWVDVVGNMQFGAGPSTIIGSNPYNGPSYGINGKVGYGFSMANQHLMLTPYGQVGMNNNAATQINELLFTSTPGVTANNYVYTAGVGGRLEYRINRAIELYADQNALENWDQSGMIGGIMPQNYASYTSTLGAKFNLAPNFQLGVKGYLTAFDNQASNKIPAIPGGYFAQRQNEFGGLVTVGLTY